MQKLKLNQLEKISAGGKIYKLIKVTHKEGDKWCVIYSIFGEVKKKCFDKELDAHLWEFKIFSRQFLDEEDFNVFFWTNSL